MGNALERKEVLDTRYLERILASLLWERLKWEKMRLVGTTHEQLDFRLFEVEIKNGYG